MEQNEPEKKEKPSEVLEKEMKKRKSETKVDKKANQASGKTGKSAKKKSEKRDIHQELDELSLKIQEVQTERDTLAEKNEEYENILKRQQAEFDNYRKRVTDERAQLIRYASEKLLKDFINIYDNFEKAVEVETEQEELRNYVEGFKLIKEQLTKMLEAHGVKESTAVGDEFNPAWHQAIQVEDEGGSEEKVKEIYQKGYFLHDRLLREAMVKIHKTGEVIVEEEEKTEIDESSSDVEVEK